MRVATLGLAALIACGGHTVGEDATSTQTTAASGGATSAGGATSTGGMVTVGAGTTGAGGGGIAPGPNCRPDFVTVMGDGAMKSLLYTCGGPCPLAYTHPVGAPEASALVVCGCDGEVAIAFEVWFDNDLVPGNYDAYVHYTDANGIAWDSANGWMTLTETIGTLMYGSYGGLVSSSSNTLSLSGTFQTHVGPEQ